MGGGESECVEAVFRLETEGNVLRAEGGDQNDTGAVAEHHAGYAAVTERPSDSWGKRLAAELELNRQTASVLIDRLLAFHRSGGRNHRQP